MQPNDIYRSFSISTILFSLFFSLTLAWGEPVTTIRSNGDPANRVDFVILGDGYTATELSKYANDVENAVTGFFSQEPLQEYQNYFNVHRVDVISNESGADHPELGIYKDTAFDATYKCAGIQRLICVNTSKVNTVLSNSVGPNQRDMVLVIVNDTEYGGSGGAIAVASTHPAVVELVLHEVGHSFGLLADEYDYGTCYTTVEPPEANVTMQTIRNLIKWNVGGGPPTGWIDPATPIPTLSAIPGVPGLYEGAKYCPSDVYRPTYNSKMRSLGVPFEQINEEQLVKRIYNWASPLDSSVPPNTNLTLPQGESQWFNVEVLEPLSHSLEVDWFLDGQYQGSGLDFTLDSIGLTVDLHTVEVTVWDPTDKVRHDPANVLTEGNSWTVQVTVSPCECDLNTDGKCDMQDWLVFGQDWGRTDCNEPGVEECECDLNRDGVCDMQDWLLFGQDWGRTDCP